MSDSARPQRDVTTMEHSDTASRRPPGRPTGSK